MVRAEWAIFEEDYWAINNVLDDLLKSSKAGNVLLIDRTGQLITQCGPDVDFDLTSFASLCAADFEANYQLAELIGEKDFSTLLPPGRQGQHVPGQDRQGVVLVVLFDKSTTLGLVRLRVKRAVEELDGHHREALTRSWSTATRNTTPSTRTSPRESRPRSTTCSLD